MLEVISDLVMSLAQIQGDNTMDQGIFANNDSIKIETLPKWVYARAEYMHVALNLKIHQRHLYIFVSLHKGSAKQQNHLPKLGAFCHKTWNHCQN